MATPSLKEKLIEKLREIEDPALLAEVSNLFELQEPDAVYQTNAAQKKNIAEAQQQAKDRHTIDSKQADEQADEWLSE